MQETKIKTRFTRPRLMRSPLIKEYKNKCSVCGKHIKSGTKTGMCHKCWARQLGLSMDLAIQKQIREAFLIVE